MLRSLRAQVLCGIISLVVLVAATLGYVTYRELNTTARVDARHLVSLTADNRKAMLVHTLSDRQQRALGVISRIESVCEGRRTPVSECAQSLLNDFVGTDVVRSALLEYRALPPLQSGAALPLESREVIEPGQLARFRTDRKGRTYYVIQARTGEDRLLTVYYDFSTLEEIFENPPELGAHGETFLVNPDGHHMTATRFPDQGRYLRSPATVLCLKGQSGVMATEDYHDENSIQAYRYVSEIGGGCVKALVLESEALAPVSRMIGRILAISFASILLAGALAVILARRMLKPLQTLLLRTEKIQRGDLESPVVVEGPMELQTFATSLGSMAQELRRMIRNREDIVSIVSHDLKTPVTAIRMNSELIEKMLGHPDTLLDCQSKIKPLAVRIQSDCDHMRSLIDDLLDLAKIEAGLLHVNRKPECLVKLTTDAVALFQGMALTKAITIEIDPLSTDVQIDCDRERLFQVFVNLIGNALKFTPSGGRISIAWEIRNDEAVVFVRDTGPGLPEKAIPFLFDRFWQDDRTNRKGVGLGLYISQQIVSAHGGKFSAANDPQGGAVFRFTISLATASAQPGPGLRRVGTEASLECRDRNQKT